jgi:hypothetical protein
MLILLLIAGSVQSSNAAIQSRTFGYEERDVLSLNANITDENSDYIYSTVTLEMFIFSFYFSLHTVSRLSRSLAH